MVGLFLYTISLLLASAEATSSGALSGACDSMQPGHPPSSLTIPDGYFLYSDLIDANCGSYEADTDYTVRLEHQSGNTFKGFLIQSRMPGTTTRIGSFINLPSGTKYLSCSGNSQASVTHNSNAVKSSVEFTWRSPSTAGTVEFRYTVVTTARANYVANINAGEHRPQLSTCTSSSTIASSSTTTSTTNVQPTSTSTTTSAISTTSTTSTSAIVGTSSTTSTSTNVVSTSSTTSTVSATPTSTPTPGCPTTDKTLSSTFPLTFRAGSNCTREDCAFYWAMGPNSADSNYLDIYMEGTTEGWMALGFSDNQMMSDTDVLGCRKYANGHVEAVDGWNPTPNYSANQRDSTQNGICTHSTGYVNGRISCLFSRKTAIIDAGQDHNLNDSLWIFRAYKTEAQPDSTGFLLKHTETPQFSSQRYNPLVDNNTAVVNNVPPCPPTPDASLPYVFEATSTFGYIVRARINADDNRFLDVFLEANVQGWVGIGFSTNQMMENDDVLACIRDSSTDDVFVVDTYNPPGQYTPNSRDSNQDGVCPYTTEFANNIIRCSFSRLIAGTDPNEDYNLDQDHFLLYATSDQRGSAISSLPQHSTRPEISSQANIARGTGATTFPVRALTRVHGILMVVAWPLLVVIAIFFATWMKPALPNGEWFQIHRAFMIISLFVTATGIIFIFVANAMNNAVSPGLISFSCGSNTTHFIFGWLVFLLQIANPLIALCRCKPTDNKRWIFNISHGTIIGLSAELLALTNVGLGIALFESQGCPAAGTTTRYTILWIYVVFVVQLIACQFVLFLVFTLIALNSPIEKRKQLAPSLMKYFIHVDTPQATELSSPANDKADPAPERKPPSSDAYVRWLFFAIFGGVTCVLMLVIIIMIAAVE